MYPSWVSVISVPLPICGHSGSSESWVFLLEMGRNPLVGAYSFPWLWGGVC